MAANLSIQPFGNGIGRINRLSADGYPKYKLVGVDVAWDLVDALTQQQVDDWGGVTPDGVPVKAGQKIILLGTPMVPILTKEVQTITLTSVTAGTFEATFEFTDSWGEVKTETVEDIPWNVTAAQLQAIADDVYGEGVFVVTKAGVVLTLTSTKAGNYPAIVTDSTGLTGGSAVVATTAQGSDNYMSYAPFDSSKTDGRQTLARDKVGLVDYTIRYLNPEDGTINPEVSHIGLIVGGGIYAERLQVGGTNQTTLAALQAVLPELSTAPAE